MARITGALLGEKAMAVNANRPMVDPSFGGQFGYSTNLVEWVSNQAYVSRNVIPILLEAPKFFQKMPNPEKWVQILKSLIELRCRSIEGLNATLSVEMDEHPVGGAGEMQEEIINVTRERSRPTFGFVEGYGRPVQTFLEQWITYGGMDPETKYSLLATMGEAPEDHLADEYTATVIFIEPDPTHSKVNKAYLSTNMFPKGTGDITAKRDLTTPGEILNLSIEFSAITQYGFGVNAFAQRLLDNINLLNANPYLRPGFIQDIHSDVLATNSGYKQGAEDMGQSAIVV